jgi:diguanylate cyclase (GGDEF)-like protein
MRNRRAFYELGQLAVEQAKRYRHPLSLLVLDIDSFKAVNDTHGHAGGDRALQAVAELLRVTVRATDVAARLGGEEFGVLLPETASEAALRLAERIRQGVSALRVPHLSQEITLTCSIGVAEREAGVESLDALMGGADQALYQAKREGRDRVVLSRGESRSSNPMRAGR